MNNSILLATHLILLLTMTFTVSSCSHQNHKDPDNKPVRLIFKNELYIVATEDETPECSYLGEVIGSEGHWYTYLFVSNTNLTQGALNQIHNKANDMGANVVFISDDLGFTTSVTFYGQAYNCSFHDNDR
jgi:hypothetical protein